MKITSINIKIFWCFLDSIDNKLKSLEKILYKNSFYEEAVGLLKISGILSAPPDMIKDITEWIKSNIIKIIVCNYTLSNLNQAILKDMGILTDYDIEKYSNKKTIYKSFNVNLENWKYFSNEFVKKNNQRIKQMSISTLEDLIRKSELSSYGDMSNIPPLGINLPDFIIQYYHTGKTISYGDAKKLLKKIKNKKNIVNDNIPDSIFVYIHLDINQNNIAEYHPSNIIGSPPAIYIYPFAISEQSFWLTNQKRQQIKDEIDEILFIVAETVNHELIHFAQDLLSTLTNSPNAGFPSKNLSIAKDEPGALYEISDYDSEDYMYLHNSSKIEFYPLIEDEISQFYRQNPIDIFIEKGSDYDDFSPVEKKYIDKNFSDAKKRFIEESEFFTILKKNSIKKWQKAISLFWSEVTIDNKRFY